MAAFLRMEEVAAWLNERGILGPKQFDLVEEPDYSKLREIRWSGFRLKDYEDLADVLAGFFKNEESVLVCVSDWATMETGDGQVANAAGLNTFYRFRQALGDSATVLDKPGHLFQNEQLDMQSLLRLVLAMLWDVYVISGSGARAARVFDMDICSLHAADGVLLDAELLERFDKLAEARRNEN